MTTAPTSRLRRAAATLLPAALAFGGVTGVAGPAAANDQYGGDAAPITVITAGPADGSTVFTSPVVFEFDAVDLDFTGSPATFQCSLSGPGILGLYFPCSSPKSYNLSAAGSYTFRVKATVDGETDPTPESRTFTYDPPAPQTMINSGPADGSTVTTSQVTFGFSSPSPGNVTFECKLQGPRGLAGFDPCTSPETVTLGYDGDYTFSVRAIRDGEADPTPATRTFTYVDNVAPDTAITAGPAAGATVTTLPTFEFSSPTDPNTTRFECGFGSAPAWSLCTSPHTPDVQPGTHTFQVRAIDQNDNVDASPASRTFTYSPPAPPPPPDTTPPETEINGGPAEGATVTSPPSYTFSSPSADTAGFRCAVDNEAFQSCTSPRVVDAGPGTHTFRVAAVDAAGNVDPSPATRRFTLQADNPPPDDTTPPNTTITAGPADGATVNSPPSYAFSSPDEDAVSFKCAVDDGAFTACTSPKVVDVAPGTHTFRVAAVDGAGNVDPSPATRSFVLSTTEPPPVDEECEEAKDRLAAKKARLQQLKEADAPKRKIRKVKRQIRRLKALVAEVC